MILCLTRDVGILYPDIRNDLFLTKALLSTLVIVIIGNQMHVLMAVAVGNII